VITELNPGYPHIYGHEGDMPHQDIMRSIDLMGKKVFPALHQIRLQPYE
jgi:hypothetical protein